MPCYIPNILLAIPRHPVTAVGLPITLGYLSGWPATTAANFNWYYVGSTICDFCCSFRVMNDLGLENPSWKASSWHIFLCLDSVVLIHGICFSCRR